MTTHSLNAIFKTTSLALFFCTLCVMTPLNLKALDIKAEKSADKFEDIFLLKSSIFEINKNELKLTDVSHGLRKKAIFGLVPVRVYTLQLLAFKPSALVKTDEGFLQSLKEAGPIQLEINFLRDLPGSKISDSFKESLEANKIKPLSDEMNALLKMMSEVKEFTSGSALSLVINWNQDKATIYIKNATAAIQSVEGPSLFAEQFLSIWFGETTDSKLKNLKKELIK